LGGRTGGGRRAFTGEGLIKSGKNPAMKTRLLFAAIAATTFTTPVLADFFIVREGASGPCHVVDTRPTDARTIVIGNKAYPGRAEAEKEIATVCPTARAVEAPVATPPAAVIVPPAVQAPLVAPPGAQAPTVAPPAIAVPVPATPCFYQGRAFSDGSTNPVGEVCQKGSWR
jgi:hypothetical protein